MNTQHFCQSCGMPVTEDSLKGTLEDGSPSDEFCTYCYQKGAFTQDVTMDEMIEICVPHLVDSGMPETDARKLMANTLPNLSRWK
ncbi:zinc ribbon domain-containing protein [uncultured Desulfobacter sp.]|uniref:zinc ribbon domain-containing protein n=1 Tax=uncultured Desulfobacter sp. TaxID=240139 RepID=UPI002AA697CA|nr:zinc ribbon domain-containing protein [uncultured Desulfobacter sp.]